MHNPPMSTGMIGQGNNLATAFHVHPKAKSNDMIVGIMSNNLQ